NYLKEIISLYIPVNLETIHSLIKIQATIRANLKRIHPLILEYASACDFEYCFNRMQPLQAQDLGQAYSVAIFLEEIHVKAIARFTYAQFTRQLLAVSED